MKGLTDGRTYTRMYVWMVDDIMAIKPNFLTSMGYQYFLSYGALCTLSSAVNTNVESSCFGFCSVFFFWVFPFRAYCYCHYYYY